MSPTPPDSSSPSRAPDPDAGLPPQTAFSGTSPFRAVVRSEVVLPAAPPDVWCTLTAFEDYEAWNPFTPRVRTELIDGAAVHLEVHMLSKHPMHRVEWMHSIVPERRLCWGMRLGPLLMANRSQWLVPLADGATLYRTDDTLTGLVTPAVMALYGAKMQVGFDAVCAGLLDVFGGAGA